MKRILYFTFLLAMFVSTNTAMAEIESITTIILTNTPQINYIKNASGEVRKVDVSTEWTPVTKVEEEAIKNPNKEYPDKVIDSYLKRVDFFHSALISNYENVTIFTNGFLKVNTKASQSYDELIIAPHVLLYVIVCFCVTIYMITKADDFFGIMWMMTFLIIAGTMSSSTTILAISFLASFCILITWRTPEKNAPILKKCSTYYFSA